ncbi:hypothetical protein [Burkholderia pseudomultivorans]|uniref:hypothetical protein n=1 Tax=Burkholderia pseudomultivorans TaxID=1207504 RepID=UPI00286FDAED|nr:hypothetical protein [Burkholderia pseudomultivorans]
MTKLHRSVTQEYVDGTASRVRSGVARVRINDERDALMALSSPEAADDFTVEVRGQAGAIPGVLGRIGPDRRNVRLIGAQTGEVADDASDDHEASVPSTVDNSTISAVICSCLKR